MNIIKCLGLIILLPLVLTACGGSGTAPASSSQGDPVAATAPSITTQPASLSVTVGATATFSVIAAGTAPLAYQWSRGGAAISGATGASYTTAATALGDSGASFTVTVTNSAGSVTSSAATLTVTAAASATTPSITTQPASQSVTVGATATFSVVATGAAPLTYQWSRGGTSISGATGASYTTAATVAGDSGASFTVTVTNSAGSVTSSAATLTVTAASATAGIDVLTHKNDISRSGLNSKETVLTTTNVKSSAFGLLRNLAVDGKVDAQPLYLSKLSIGSATHNVVIVATEHASVYAFDADSGTKLWQVSLLKSGETPSDDRGCGQVTPEIGITSTPVIDRGAGHGTIYLVAMSKDGSGTYHQRLHALDATTGAATSGPTEIGAMVTTQGGGTNTFEPGSYVERSALLLSKGFLYLSFSSHCDATPYSGWELAYTQSSLAMSGTINVGPNSQTGPAIWMAGAGPAADAAGNVFLLTANGAFETTLTSAGFPNQGDYGNSFVKIVNSGTALSIGDYFAVTDTVAASVADRDLGSGGGMLLPDQTVSGVTRHLMLGAGKDGNIYVVDRDNMGKFSASANNIFQTVTGVGSMFASPAYFNGMVFFGPINSALKQYKITAGKLSAAPSAQSTVNFPYPGSAMSISANGTAEGIVWAHDNNSTTAVLHAFRASDLTEIYNSNQAAGNRDHFGAANKYITPTVTDGKVFVGTQNSVGVFGLL